MYAFSKYTIYFLIYSFVGAVGETLFRLITEQQLHGIHGYLNLPIMPIYGFGAILVIWLFKGRIRNPIIMAIVGAVFLSIFEFVSHWLIEATLGIRIWDYSHKLFNLDGRVSLDNSIAFGIAVPLLVYVMHPFVEKIVKKIPSRQAVVAAAVIFVIVFVDFVYSTITKLS